MVSLQIVMLGAPTSLASIMVIGSHGGDSSEVGQQEHMVRQGFTRKDLQESAGLSSCVLATISPRRAKLGGRVFPAGCARPAPLRRPPPLAPRRRARGRSPIGYIHMLAIQWLVGCTSHSRLVGRFAASSPQVLCFDRPVTCPARCRRLGY
jgi:hypothetical protein